jgi:hypothetical protein
MSESLNKITITVHAWNVIAIRDETGRTTGPWLYYDGVLHDVTGNHMPLAVRTRLCERIELALDDEAGLPAMFHDNPASLYERRA